MKAKTPTKKAIQELLSGIKWRLEGSLSDQGTCQDCGNCEDEYGDLKHAQNCSVSKIISFREKWGI